MITLPLAATQAEQAVIGGVFMRNDAYWACAEAGLKPEHFSSTLHQRLWEAVSDLLVAGSEAKPVALHRRFAGDEELAQHGGARYLAELAAAAVGIVDVAGYAGIVVDWAARRQMYGLAQRLEAEALDGQAETGKILAMAETALADCRLMGAKAGQGPVSMTQATKGALEAAERAYQRKMVDGVSTSLRGLDSLLGGFAKSDLIVLAGRPGMGKSALASRFVTEAAREGHGAGFFSLEMSAEQLTQRIMADRCSIDVSRIKTGRLIDGEMHAIIEASRQIETLPIVIDATPQVTPADIRARLKRLQPALKGGLGLVVVDYLQLMQSDMARRDANRVLEIGQITGALKGIAKDFNVPLIALSQLSRAVEQRDDKRPQLSDLRDSGSIEQDADVVIFVYREEYYLKKSEPTDPTKRSQWEERMARAAGRAELIVDKNRHGPTGSAMVAFNGKFTRFENLDERA